MPVTQGPPARRLDLHTPAPYLGVFPDPNRWQSHVKARVRDVTGRLHDLAFIS